MRWDTPLGRLGARLGLLLGSTGFALLLAEAGLRWAVPTLVDSPYHCVWPPHLRAVFNPDPAIMPGIRGQSLFVTNSRGLRGDEMTEGRSYRILAVGGSTTENLFLDQTEAWPHLLQVRLSQEAPGRPVWVGNAGRSGLGTRDHVVQLRYLLPELPRIDAAVFLIGVNDLTLRNLQDSHYDPLYMSRPAAEGDLLPRAFAVYPLGNPALSWQRRTAVWQLARNVTRRLQAAGRDHQDQAGGHYARWREERRNAIGIRETMPDLKAALEEYSRNVNTLIDLAQARGVRPIFLTQPTIWRRDLPPELVSRLWVGKIGDSDEGGHEYYSVGVLADEMRMYNETLASTCRSRGVEWFDLASGIPKDGSAFYDDDHYTEKGSEMVADAIARFMRDGALLREPVPGS